MLAITGTFRAGVGCLSPGSRVAAVSPQLAGDQLGYHLHLEVRHSRNRDDRPDPGSKRRRQCHPLQQLLAPLAEQFTHRHLHPTAGQSRWLCNPVYWELLVKAIEPWCRGRPRRGHTDHYHYHHQRGNGRYTREHRPGQLTPGLPRRVGRSLRREPYPPWSMLRRETLSA
jgi:hypothetical protein